MFDVQDYMADHNPPYLFELDGNKDPEELFEVCDLHQAVMPKGLFTPSTITLNV